MTARYTPIEQLTDPILGALFGTPLSLLTVLLTYYYVERQSTFGVRDLAGRLNQSEKTISKGLRTLQHYGLVNSNARYDGWHLTQGALQLPLMRIMLGEGAGIARASLRDPGANDPATIIITQQTSMLDLPPQTGDVNFTSPTNREREILRLDLEPTPGDGNFTSPAKTREREILRLDLEPTPGDGNFTSPEPREREILRLPDTSLSCLKSCCLTDSESEQQQLQLVARAALEATELEQNLIEGYLQRYPPEYLIQQCDYYDWARHTPKRSGEGTYADEIVWLKHCITNHYRPPRAYVPKSERCPHCYRRLSDHAFDCPSLRPDHDMASSGSPCLAEQPSDEPSAPHESFSAVAPEHGPDPALIDAWKDVLVQLREGGLLRRGDFETWVSTLIPGTIADGVVTLYAPTSPTRDWVSSRLGKILEKLFSAILARPVAVAVVYAP